MVGGLTYSNTSVVSNPLPPSVMVVDSIKPTLDTWNWNPDPPPPPKLVSLAERTSPTT